VIEFNFVQVPPNFGAAWLTFVPKIVAVARQMRARSNLLFMGKLLLKSCPGSGILSQELLLLFTLYLSLRT
jgi:hypothetical protein